MRDQEELLVVDRLDRYLGSANRKSADEHVDRARAQIVDQLIGQTEPGDHPHPVRQSGRQGRKDHLGQELRRAADEDRATLRTVLIGQGRDLGELIDRGGDPRGKLLSAIRGPHTRGAAIQQPVAEVAFQACDLLGHRRLGKPELIGRRGERAGAEHRDEHAQRIP